MRARSLPLLGALVIATPAAALLVLSTPAQAAGPTPCPTATVTAANCSIHWTGSALTQDPVKIYAGVTITFVNDDTGLAGNSVRFTESSAKPVFDKTVAKGDTVAVKFSAVRVMTYTATSGAALNPPTDTGKITVVAKPTPSPTPTTSHSPSPKPQPSTGPSPQPGSTPPPGTSVLGQGLSQVPQFGSGTLFPSPGASSAPLGPVIATDPSASPTPAPSTDQAATSLSQPVDARRLGLPGALAAVLVAGVVVGVVRLARAEFGDGTNHGGGAPPAPPVH